MFLSTAQPRPLFSCFGSRKGRMIVRVHGFGHYRGSMISSSTSHHSRVLWGGHFCAQLLGNVGVFAGTLSFGCTRTPFARSLFLFGPGNFHPFPTQTSAYFGAWRVIWRSSCPRWRRLVVRGRRVHDIAFAFRTVGAKRGGARRQFPPPMELQLQERKGGVGGSLVRTVTIHT